MVRIQRMDCLGSMALFIHLVIMLMIHYLLARSSIAGTNITTDQSALLALKAQIISDPYEVLKNWTLPSSVCSWTGVTCGKRHHRVTGLNISNMGFVGSIPPELGNLSFLVSLDISSNNFSKALPPDLVRLRRLRSANLDFNKFTGEVPSWFSSFPQLVTLSLMNNSFSSLTSFLESSMNGSNLAILVTSFNSFQGIIPDSIDSLNGLRELHMNGNGFTGFIPPSIMNLSNLHILDLSINSLQGTIPAAIGNLQKLIWLSVTTNQLTGSIPLGLFNISTLETVDLSRNGLYGALPNELCLGLPVLKRISFSFNQLSGQVPSNLSTCHELQVLFIFQNSISGTIPQEIGSMEMLQSLAIGKNMLTGSIPAEIGKLGNLRELGLESNMLTGSIPLTLFNMSSLQSLVLQFNTLSGHLSDHFRNLTKLNTLVLGSNNFSGDIPPVFDALTELQSLDLGINNLNSPIPSYVFNISNLGILQLSGNGFSGTLPANIGRFLPNLAILLLADNNLGGVLPSSISNSSQLIVLDLSVNKFSGSIPNSLIDLKFLQKLSFPQNNFTCTLGSFELSFITSLTSSRDLTYLDINNNPFDGILPVSIGNLSSSLQYFSVSTCKIKGSIPEEFGNLSGLVSLFLDGNDLSGEIPIALSRLPKLQQLRLGNNHLTGRIPSSLCNLQNLGSMLLNQNQLIGSIPECLGNVLSLRYINLSSNNLTSGLPASIWGLNDLLELDISSNSFTGFLSSQIGNLMATTTIDLSMNTLGGLAKLVNLSVAHNKFNGSIPESMGSMKSLTFLDLSHNMLSGIIPMSLVSLENLEHFNVSFNELSGEIPTSGPFTNFTSQSFAFNAALCGPPRFQVPPCKEAVRGSKRRKVLQLAFILSGIASLTFIGTMIFIIIKYCKKGRSAVWLDTITITVPARISYHELSQATNGYSEDNLLGRGSLGSVYKGVLMDGTILAIKVFNLQVRDALKSFDVECEVLRNLRHRNLIEVVSTCSNEDFKALILEYMPNGSLEKWLYSNDNLDIIQRMNIMIDVASALEYLHHGYSTPVVHCDLKPSNVLMDENMVAHVSDFGITKFLGVEESITHTKTFATLGYMAPEYGLEGRVSTKCDVYSYGIMLLETFTRKQPSDEIFHGDLNIKNWVKDSLPNALTQIIDDSLIRPEEMNLDEALCCASAVMELGLICCDDSPRERMNMKDALADLKKIKVTIASTVLRN